jgi:phenylpropionate dioxygenase-like ring-hydroxylating dioxygenase large terminal subunit
MAMVDSIREERAPRRGLDGRHYVGADIFAAARREIFAKAWRFAGHLSQLRKAGDYAATADGEIFAMRGDDGALRAFFNVCRHRGHPLISGEAGHASDLVCPYHSWQYDVRGRLVAARNLDKVAGVRRGDIRLCEARLAEFCGFVFVNADANAPPMEDIYPGVADAIRAACPDIESRRFAFARAADEKCNWLIAVENYNECYHCKVAHRAFARGVVDARSYNIAPFGGGKCLRHTAKAASGRSAWTAAKGASYNAFFLWPSFAVQIYPGAIVNTYHWLPLAADDTRVFRGWYRGGEDEAELRKIADLDFTTTFSEDLKIVAEVQRGVKNPGYRPGPLVVNPGEGIDSEHSVAVLHDWFLRAVGEEAAR